MMKFLNKVHLATNYTSSMLIQQKNVPARNRKVSKVIKFTRGGFIPNDAHLFQLAEEKCLATVTLGGTRF